MIIRSLALSTELGLAATRGTITDRGEYLVVETPDDPGYYYGNLLVLPAPPQVGEVAYWMRRFGEELGKPGVRHITLWWDGVTGEAGAADELCSHGFTLETSQLMVADDATEAPARAVQAPLALRELTADEVLETAELAWAIGDRHDETYRQFLNRRAAWQRELVIRRIARFWGAHDGDVLAASLGLATLGTLARYQDVQTLPAYRRRGLASALLATAARTAFATGVERAVIVATPESDAARIYARAGFRTIELTTSACRYPPGSRARRITHG